MTLPKLHEEIVASTGNGNDMVVVIDDVSAGVPETVIAVSGDDDWQMLFGSTGGDLRPGDDDADDFNI